MISNEYVVPEIKHVIYIENHRNKYIIILYWFVTFKNNNLEITTNTNTNNMLMMYKFTFNTEESQSLILICM